MRIEMSVGGIFERDTRTAESEMRSVASEMRSVASDLRNRRDEMRSCAEGTRIGARVMQSVDAATSSVPTSRRNGEVSRRT